MLDEFCLVRDPALGGSLTSAGTRQLGDGFSSSETTRIGHSYHTHDVLLVQIWRRRAVEKVFAI